MASFKNCLLYTSGMEVKLFEGIESDPSVETVMKGAAVMTEFEPDWIVAIGGGSPIDAAKAMWIKYEYPDTCLLYTSNIQNCRGRY